MLAVAQTVLNGQTNMTDRSNCDDTFKDKWTWLRRQRHDESVCYVLDV